MAALPRNLSLRGLRTFCVAAELESFRHAADRLYVTASAVSHQIKNLERELGRKLFERQQRRLTLTETGRALLGDIKPLIDQLDAVTTRYRNAEVRSTLSISVQPFFATELFVPRLSRFRDRHPEIEIAVDTSDESAEVHPGNADASIRIFKAPPASLTADRLFPLQLIPASSPAFRDQLRLQGNEVVSEFPLVLHASRPHAWLDWQKSSGIKLPPNASALRLESMIAVARAAEKGLGAALVPRHLSDRWFSSGSLVPLFDEVLQVPDAFYLVSSTAAANDTNIKRLRDWVLQEFAWAA